MTFLVKLMPEAAVMTNTTQTTMTDPAPSAAPQLPDPRPLHRRAMTQTESIVAAVEPGQLGNSTPCAEYDVRALLSHIVGGLNRVAIAGEGGDAMA
jgi:mycothiol maleylpyruvate isomerase-like protein